MGKFIISKTFRFCLWLVNVVKIVGDFNGEVHIQGDAFVKID